MLVIAVTEFILVLAMTAAFIWFFSSEARSLWAGAPFSPMPERMLGPLLAMVAVKADDVFVDLGCGDGRVLLAARREGAGSVVGYDVAWWPLFLARRRCRGSSGVRIQREDARTADVTQATVVYMYLYPKLVQELAGILAARLRVGTRVLCPAFPIDTTQHTAYRLIDARKVGTITAYLYERT